MLAFLVGLAVEAWTPYPDLFARYVVSYRMPVQVAVGLAAASIYGAATGRGGLSLWHGLLWTLGGIAAGWVLWSVVLVFL